MVYIHLMLQPFGSLSINCNQRCMPRKWDDYLTKTIVLYIVCNALRVQVPHQSYASTSVTLDEEMSLKRKKDLTSNP